MQGERDGRCGKDPHRYADLYLGRHIRKENAEKCRCANQFFKVICVVFPLQKSSCTFDDFGLTSVWFRTTVMLASAHLNDKWNSPASRWIPLSRCLVSYKHNLNLTHPSFFLKSTWNILDIEKGIYSKFPIIIQL